MNLKTAVTLLLCALGPLYLGEMFCRTYTSIIMVLLSYARLLRMYKAVYQPHVKWQNGNCTWKYSVPLTVECTCSFCNSFKETEWMYVTHMHRV